MLICCGLAATGLAAFLHHPRSRGRACVAGLAGLVGVIAIPLLWTSLTAPVSAAKLSTVRVDRTVHQTVTTRLVFDLPKGDWPVQLRLQAYADEASERKDIATVNLSRR